MEIGDSGWAKFFIERDGFKRGVVAYVVIKKIEGELITFSDGDGFKYSRQLKDFEFKKK